MVGLIAVTGIIAACGSETEAEQPERQASIVATGAEEITTVGSSAAGPIDWAEPLPMTEPFENLSDAAAQLSFVPASPGDLGAPARILVSRTDAAPRTQRHLLYVYDHKVYGVFYVHQQPLEGSREVMQASIEGRADPRWCPEGNRCPATQTAIVLENGQNALLVMSPYERSGTNFIKLLHPTDPILIEIVGPPDSFDQADGYAVANRLIRAATH